jgi:AcrR family transcriptional regulator
MMPLHHRPASPKEMARRARRDVHRQNLVETAERVFAASGYEGTRMQDVAAAAGLAIATVYKVFDSKEELYAEVHKTRGGAMLEAASAAAMGAGSAWHALFGGVKAYAEYLVEHPEYLMLHLQESQPWALHPRFTTTSQTTLWRSGLELLVKIFRAAIDDGDAIDESPLLLARLMIAAHQVFLGQWVEEGMKEPAHELVGRMQAYVERSFGRARAVAKKKRA